MKSKVIAYCRISTENQKEDGTIEIQKNEILNFCESNSLEVLKTFSDEATSGSIEIHNRFGLVELIDFISRESDIYAVVIYKLDRLARDLSIQEQIISLFDSYGVKLVSTKEPDLNGDDPTRKFIRQILGATAEFEKSMIAMRMKAGRLNKAKGGGYSGGCKAYGYSRVTKTKGGRKIKDLKIDYKQSGIIQRIFNLKKAGNSFRQIAKQLNEQNIKTARGKTWYASTIRYILSNPIYKGEMIYNAAMSERHDLAIIKDAYK